MSESMAQVEVRTLRVPEAGVLMTVMTSSSNLVEKVLAGGFDVVKLVRGEVFRATGAGVDWVEAVQHSAFKIVREAIQRSDILSRDAVEGMESVTSAVVRTVRGSTEALGDLACSTADMLVGKRAASAKAA